MEKVFSDLTLDELADKYGTAYYMGKTYTLIQDVFIDRESGRDVFMALSTLGPDEEGHPTVYPVIWNIVNPDAEDIDDVCDWNTPSMVIGHSGNASCRGIAF